MNAKTKLQELGEHLKAADEIANSLLADSDHGRSHLVAPMRLRISGAITLLESHAAWLAENPAPKVVSVEVGTPAAAPKK